MKAPDSAPPSQHYQWLDFLRLMAALTVVLGHARGFTFEDYGSLEPASQGILTAAFFALTRIGHEAVIVFFVLSGFLVGGRAIERIRNGAFNPRDYAIDRTTRILIPLAPALLLSGLASGFTDGATVWLGNLMGLQGVLVPVLGSNGPLWSLAYEVWFYMLIYAAGRLALTTGKDATAYLIIALVAVIFLKLQAQYLLCWLIGAAFYLRPDILPAPAAWIAAAIICAAATLGLQISSEGSMSRIEAGTTARALLEVLLATGAGLACIALLRQKPNGISSYSAPLAKFSYSLYLTHYPILIILRKMGLQPATVMNLGQICIYIGTICICLFAAWLTYLPFEKRTPLIRDWLKSQLRHE